jgi:hypothetical protein
MAGKKKPARGRPPKMELNDDTLQKIAALRKIQCTEEEAASVLGVSQPTFSRFLNKHKKASEAWDHGVNAGKVSLRRMQYKLAEKGNATMLIWLGKQYLGQKDQRHIEGETRSVNYNISDSPSEADWADAFVTQH